VPVFNFWCHQGWLIQKNAAQLCKLIWRQFLSGLSASLLQTCSSLLYTWLWALSGRRRQLQDTHLPWSPKREELWPSKVLAIPFTSVPKHSIQLWMVPFDTLWWQDYLTKCVHSFIQWVFVKCSLHAPEPQWGTK
jgi:hypothetical protein